MCKVRGDHNLSELLTTPIGLDVRNMHLSRMHFTFPDSNLKLNLCNSAHRVCTHDPLRLEGRGGCLDEWAHGLAGTHVHMSSD